jgi:hypothetical protein
LSSKKGLNTPDGCWILTQDHRLTNNKNTAQLIRNRFNDTFVFIEIEVSVHSFVTIILYTYFTGNFKVLQKQFNLSKVTSTGGGSPQARL